jgi:phage antirepressor YoqD-like protein
MRPAAFDRPWTPSEKRMLRRVYPTGVAAAVKALPGRSLVAVQCMAKKLGVHARIRTTWTDEESETLRRMWGWEPIYTISRALNKTPKAIFYRSVILGLRLVVPEGYDFVTNAAERAGFSVKAFQRIMRIYRVPVRAHYGRTRERGKRCYHHHIVDLERADEAVAKFMKTENLRQAAKARGLDTRRLVCWLTDAGVRIIRTGNGPKPFMRASTEDIDRVVADRRGYEWITEGARRHGISQSTLRNWLLKHGCKPKLGHAVKVRKSDVDMVVQVEMAKAAPTRRAA